MAVYSFLDVAATITGPGGSIPLGTGAGAAEEGIDIKATQSADDMKIGADGSAMHSLRADKSGKITVKLLKTSPTNALLTAMMNFQRTSALFWGQNVLVITDIIRGDVYTCQAVAFEKVPDNTFAKDAGMLDWEFLAGQIDPLLGAGLPGI